MKKKKILFTTFDLNIGGIEKCLVNLVNNLDKNKYDITIYLQVKEGDYLKNINDNVKVLGYNLSYIKGKKINNKLVKIIVNLFKFIKILITNYHKYDVSIYYGTGYVPSSILSLTSSKYSIGWMHTNILTYMENYIPYKNQNITTEQKAKKFINKIFFRKYKKNIFVSNDALCAYLKVYPQDKEKSEYIYNLIDYENIINKCKEKISEKHTKYTFLNVGRQTEFDIRLTRIINATKILVDEGYDFKVLLVGEGKDTNYYKDLVKDNKLTKYIEFLGKKNNPYPYFKISDVFILSSEFEGLPTTLLESLTLNLPIITTNVSDSKTLIDKKYGIVVDKSDKGIYLGMKEYLDNKIIINDSFNSKKYNENIISKLERVINND